MFFPWCLDPTWTSDTVRCLASWPVLPVVFEAESFSEAKQKKNRGWMRFCFPCWTPDEKVPASKQPVNPKCCGQCQPTLEPPLNRWKGAVASLEVWIQHFKYYLYRMEYHSRHFLHPDYILKVYDCCPLDGEASILELRTWLPGASPRLSEETQENAWNMHGKQGKEIVLRCASFARRGWALMLHVLCGYYEDGLNYCKSLMIDGWWLMRMMRMIIMMMTTIEDGFFPNVWLVPFQVLQISSHEVAIVSRCCLRGHSYRQVGAFSVRYWEWKEATADGKQEQTNSDEAWLG